jgi:DNA polymerase elongation subunit (family B)
MDIKEELQKYNLYYAKISKIEMEIHTLESETLNLKSPTLDGLPRAIGFSNSTMEEKIVKKLGKISEKKFKIQVLKDKIDLLNKLIKTLKEYQQRIIKARFIDNIDMNIIAEKEKKEYRTIQANIDSAINEMQKNYDKIENV